MNPREKHQSFYQVHCHGGDFHCEVFPANQAPPEGVLNTLDLDNHCGPHRVVLVETSYTEVPREALAQNIA